MKTIFVHAVHSNLKNWPTRLALQTLSPAGANDMCKCLCSRVVSRINTYVISNMSTWSNLQKDALFDGRTLSPFDFVPLSWRLQVLTTRQDVGKKFLGDLATADLQLEGNWKLASSPLWSAPLGALQMLSTAAPHSSGPLARWSGRSDRPKPREKPLPLPAPVVIFKDFGRYIAISVEISADKPHRIIYNLKKQEQIAVLLPVGPGLLLTKHQGIWNARRLFLPDKGDLVTCIARNIQESPNIEVLAPFVSKVGRPTYRKQYLVIALHLLTNAIQNGHLAVNFADGVCQSAKKWCWTNVNHSNHGSILISGPLPKSKKHKGGR